MAQDPIVVVGAGMVGVSTAIWLQRFGHRVVLIDKDGPAAGASFGNAGIIASWAIVPVNTPDLWRTAPKYLLSPNSPLFLKLSSVPKLLPWLWSFMRHANAQQTDRAVSQLGHLLHDAVDQHHALVKDTDVANWVANSKMSYVYRDMAQFKADAQTWAYKAEHGFVPEVITGRAVQDEEPILNPDLSCLAVLSGQGHITDPAGYIQALVAAFERAGGTFIQTELTDFEMRDDDVCAVITGHGRIACTKAVVTAGVWSQDILRKLGLSVPLAAERGYHLTFKDPSIMPRNPMLMADGKFGVNPMDVGLRCAGMVELGDHNAPPSAGPLKLLRKHVSQAFPTLDYTSLTEWMGFRPTTPDSLPVIGEIGKTGVYCGFGHQHIGMTAGPKTGRWIAQMISDETPNADLSAFDPARF